MEQSSGRPAFRIALSLSGAVAAGAYTAGVLDFLIEALDAWHAREDAPHDVVLYAVTGASAGSVCATLLAKMLAHRFSPLHNASAAHASGSHVGRDNPLYDAWVNRFGITDLLACDDFYHDHRVLSLLNGRHLDRVFEQVMTLPGEPTRRRYVADPLRLRFTLTNLSGTPFSAMMTGNSGEGLAMVRHEDQLRFALSNLGTASALPPQPSGDCHREEIIECPGENAENSYAIWRPVAEAALASAAIPLALAPRRVQKPSSDYDRIPMINLDARGRQARLRFLSADWGQSAPGSNQFLAVDGGLLHNEPLELARQALNDDDPLHRCPGSGRKADRAVIMIDPFVGLGPTDLTPQWDTTLGQAANLVLRGLGNQVHYRPLDLLLAADPGVYSRFLIAPDRGDPTTVAFGRSLASGALKGFSGYFSSAFRAHDFQLGRRNCQRFLSQWFLLNNRNALFEHWPKDLRKQYTLQKNQLPILPLSEELQREEALPSWPKGAFGVHELEPALGARMDALVTGLTAELSLLYRPWLRLGWKTIGRRKLIAWTKQSIERKLREHDLL